VNTPQFSWVRSRLPRHPQPVPPIYQPEVAARAVAVAAAHPRRREYWVGASTVATITANRIAPALLDRYLARTGYRSQQTAGRTAERGPGNLWQPADGPGEADHGAHGAFDDRSHPHSAQLWLTRHARVLTGAAAAAGVGLTALLRRRSHPATHRRRESPRGWATRTGAAGEPQVSSRRAGPG